VTGSKRLEVKL